jgi:thymidylate synthase (FAD)
MSGNLRSWVHYLQLRTGNGTQKEHQEIADMCVIEIAKVFPMITDLVKFSNEKI